ncbi:Stabilizer of axonemal microtubule 2 [Taenia crassiceps]|uniref:Stabilizer of axonemal microtubule 2 n=1 Tax=Taenia crassiceps TaxID=6207 RepID=A0ABR4QMM6_9CEST
MSSQPLCSETTHRSDFIPLPLEPRTLKKSEIIHISEGKFEGQSVYTSEFTEKGFVRVDPIKPKQSESVQGKFVGEATYTVDYKAWDLEPQQSCGPKYQYRKPSADFKGEPIYTTDYVDHGNVKPPSAFKPLVQQIQSEPFDAISTFTADYVPKHGDKQKPFRPNYATVHSDLPFSNETTHRTDYIEWPLSQQHHRNPEEYKPNSVEFEGQTTYATNYIPMKCERAKIIKPAYQKLDPNREFSDLTNYKKEYRKWSLKGRSTPAREPFKYIPPEAPFDGQTVYQNEYVPKQCDPCPVLQLQSNPDVICEGEDQYGHEFYSTRVHKKQNPSAIVATN